MKRIFTSESVTEGHPDKVCDRISDAILDEMIKLDPNCRVACETTATTGMVNVMGEITLHDGYADIPRIVRDTVKEIGYCDPELGFDYRSLAINTAINEQSADIALGVDESLERKAGDTDVYDSVGAGDQGMMFGYATDETPEYMPLPLTLSHKLCMRLAEVRKSGELKYLRPDGKAQVSVEYDDQTPVRIEAVVVSAQHSPDVDIETLRRDIREHVIDFVIPAEMTDENTKYYINPTGRFCLGGPAADTGLTGRKIIVDTYGGYARHGGGSFSGKDPTKVDRSAAYMTRYIAKNIVAAGLADKCEIQVAYAIGVATPVSIFVDTFQTGRLPGDVLSRLVAENFDLRPSAIIEKLGLRSPIYGPLASYGHMGRDDLDIPWEKTDMAGTLGKSVRQ